VVEGWVWGEGEEWVEEGPERLLRGGESSSVALAFSPWLKKTTTKH
jgi:hypothetical protein